MITRRQVLGVLASMTLACDHACQSARQGDSHPLPEPAPRSKAGVPKYYDVPMLVGVGGLERLRARAERDDPAYERLRENADAHLRSGAPSGAANLSVMYLATQDAKYARAAYALAKEAMTRDVRDDSYLHFGEILGPVSLVLDHCSDALAAPERKLLGDFLARWCHELWFDNQGSGWGLDDPGNNYHMAFLEGTAFAAYALARRKDARAGELMALLYDKVEGPKGVLAYIDRRGAGGDWQEGANYGQRAKQRLFTALSVMESMSGPRYFTRHRFFRDSIFYAVYQLQPDGRSIYPSGDLARSSSMLASPYDRDYVQMATYWIDDAEAKALGRWYLHEVVPSYDGEEFSFREAYYKDLLFAVDDGPTRSPETLPRSYVASGSGWVTVRSGWDRDATCLCVSGASQLDQSHGHIDVGSFTLFKGGWQAVDAATYSRSGLLWQAGAHNMVHVAGHQRRMGTTGGLKRFHHGDGLAYLQIDAADQFRRRRSDDSEQQLLSEYTREIVYLEPDTLVTYDRVRPAGDVAYDNRVHFAERPRRLSDRQFQGEHGRGGMSVAIVQGGAASVRGDGDLDEGGSRAWRVEVKPEGDGHFLTVLRVGLGEAPPLLAEPVSADGGVVGVLLEQHVVLARRRLADAKGSQPWSYRIPAGAERQHVLLNAAGSYDLSTRREGGTLHVELRPGSRHRADAHGIVRFRTPA